MTEIRTLHWTDNSILNAAMRNEGYRAMAKDIAEMVMFLMHGKTADAGSAGVLGGFELTVVTGQLQVTIAPGWGWFYNASIPAPASPFGAVHFDQVRTLNLLAGSPSGDRYDLISIQAQSVLDTEQSVPFWQAAPQNIPTQRGCQTVLTVTRGAPATFPFIPSTPSGHIALGAVRVPASATNLNAATLVDLRDHLSLSCRESEKPIRFKSIPYTSSLDSKPFHLIEVLKSNQAPGTGSKLTWDRNEDWLSFQRSTQEAGEQTGVDFFPMAIPGGRTWRRNVSWLGCMPVGSDPTGLTVSRHIIEGSLVYQRTAATAGLGSGSLVTIPVESRGLRVTGASLRYQVTSAFDGTPTLSPTIELWVSRAGGAACIGIKTLSFAAAHSGGATEVALDMNETPVLEASDTLYALLAFSYLGGASTGTVYVQAVSVEFEEGHGI